MTPAIELTATTRPGDRLRSKGRAAQVRLMGAIVLIANNALTTSGVVSSATARWLAPAQQARRQSEVTHPARTDLQQGLEGTCVVYEQVYTTTLRCCISCLHSCRERPRAKVNWNNYSLCGTVFQALRLHRLLMMIVAFLPHPLRRAFKEH